MGGSAEKMMTGTDDEGDAAGANNFEQDNNDAIDTESVEKGSPEHAHTEKAPTGKVDSKL